jgi:uncharacterized membrane protein
MHRSRCVFAFASLLPFASLALGCDPSPPRDVPEIVAPPPPGITFFADITEARDVSPDGRTVLLESLGFGRLFLFDTIDGTLTEQTTMPFVERNQALGVSNNGRISAEVGNPVTAGLWTGEEWLDIGSPFDAGCVDPTTNETTDIAGAWDVSADGNAVVGLAYDVCTPAAYLWRDGAFTVLERLGVPLSISGRSEPVNRASVISDDGTVVAGWAENDVVDRSPAIWRTDGSGFMLDPNDFDRPGEILSLTSDGRAFAGVWANEGFIYTEEDGVTYIGRFPESLPFDGVFPNALAVDGDLAFGTNGFKAFVWTPAHGMRSLRDVVVAAGLVEIPETHVLANVNGISSDGTVIAGTAVDTSIGPNGTQVSFVLRLPVSSYE